MAWSSKVRADPGEGQGRSFPRLPRPRILFSADAPKHIGWLALAVAGAAGWGVLALHRGETISAAWLVLAAVGTYLIAYRFYSRFLAYRVFGLNDRRATPAERLATAATSSPPRAGSLFGHHFAAIAGAGPLVGPVLAAQFGYLPGTIWIVFGVVLGGRRAGLHHPLRLHAARRQVAGADGARKKSARSPGCSAMVAMLPIMVILLAVLAWWWSTRSRTAPGAPSPSPAPSRSRCLMGFWMKVLAPGHDARGLGPRRGAAAAGPGRRPLVAESPALAPLLHPSRPHASPAASSPTASSPACCRSGCCSPRATTSPPS